MNKDLDRLVQQLCTNHRCYICGIARATAIHHIIGRANPLLRYDIVNLLPVCEACHRKIHDKNLDVSKYIPKEQWQYLQQIKNQSYKDILTFELQLSEKEFLARCKKTIKELLSQ